MNRVTLMLSLCAAFAAAVLGFAPKAHAINFGAVMMAGDYPGPPAFDDNLSISRAAMADAFATWPQWRRGAGGNIDELAGNATAAQFLAKIAARGAALGAGDLLVVFYFGHGSIVFGNELPPALNTRDEVLYFPDGSKVSDDQLTATLSAMNPGLYKLVVNVSCHSGGFWNGNDPGAEGDLERVPRCILLRSSNEGQLTYAGGLGPRPWEPLYLRNLIFNMDRRIFGWNSRTILTWHRSSAVFGSVINANRFGEVPGELAEPVGNDYWMQEFSGDFASEDETLVPETEIEEDLGGWSASRCVGDANGDALINFLDITSALQAWNQDYTTTLGGTGDGDADDSGVVDFNDVAAVLAEWLTNCPDR